MTDLENAALQLATAAHRGQQRKYTGEPYIAHPVAVANLVRSVPHDEAMIAAALCHDVVEDTAVSIEQIATTLGSEVAGLVSDLTDVSRPGDGNRATRKAIDRAHSAAASARAQTIKCADLIENAASILERDPKFAKVFLREMEELLAVLTQADASLRRTALKIVHDARTPQRGSR